ncbi:DUF4230 domain-containing protein [Micromonospora sonneratiae]|uniref:DUF4230 domain-containing protein n=1 Tax=Micromonospora sonneratiae TaxID=1184706 RepID=A0ABW3Y9F6_9ACTN
MSRNGDVNEPTREFPEYAKGRATPDSASSDPATRSDDDGPGAGQYDSTDDARRTRPDLVESSSTRRGRGLFWLAGVVGLVIVLVLGGQAAGLWPQWRNPFAQQQSDRSQPPLLKSIQDLSRYVAAEGNFQVVIDLQKDRKYVPDFLLSERTLFVGAGSVVAFVDFSTIAEGAIVESADRKTVEIKLPAPQLGETNLDLKNSYVFAEKRGLVNRIGDVFGGDPNRQREVFQLAEQRIGLAARDSGLTDRAQENTRKMLEGLLRSLGYTTVTVSFVAP